MASVFSQLLDQIVEQVEDGTNLTQAPMSFSASNIPDTLSDRVFTIDFQSNNTNKFRDRQAMRLSHTVTISILWRIKPRQEYVSQKAQLDEEINVIRTLLVQSQVPSVRVLYGNSSRQRNSSKEYIIANVVFDIEQTVTLDGGGQVVTPITDDLVPLANNFIVGDGSKWDNATPAEARDAIQLDDADDVTFGSVTSNDYADIATYLDLQQTTTPADPGPTVARIWQEDVGGKTFLRHKNGDSVILDLTHDQHFVAVNKSGGTISKGDAVYATGAQGVFLEVDLADASDIATMPARGIAMENAANNAKFRVMESGSLTSLSIFPTSTYNDGDEVWVSATTPGKLTNVEPTHPNIRQSVGYVKNASSGGSGRLHVSADTHRDGSSTGTSENSFSLGDGTAGAKSFVITNGNEGTLQWNPTANRTLTLPDETGTIFTDADSNLNDVSDASVADGNFLVGDGNNFVTESGDTARTSLGVGTGDSPVFAGLNIEGSSAFIDLDEIATPSAPGADEARVYAKDKKGFSQLQFLDASGLDIDMLEDTILIVRNETGSTITKGQAVYAVGSSGNVPNVDLAHASQRSTLPAIGVAKEDIADNSFGRIVTEGTLMDFDTSAFNEGDELYVSDSVSGGLTATEPSHPDIQQHVATVTVSGIGNGELYVSISDLDGKSQGTILNTYKIGDATAGTKAVDFVADNIGSLEWTPTASRTLTLPDETGTVLTDNKILSNRKTSTQDVTSTSATAITGTNITLEAGVYYEVKFLLAANSLSGAYTYDISFDISGLSGVSGWVINSTVQTGGNNLNNWATTFPSSHDASGEMEIYEGVIKSNTSGTFQLQIAKTNAGDANLRVQPNTFARAIAIG